MSVKHIEDAMASDNIATLNLSMFDDDDIVNVVLQRSAVLYDVQRGGRLIRSWSAGDPDPLREVVATKGHDLIRRALAMIYLEYHEFRDHLSRDNVRHICDIGCGYAFFDLFLHQEHGAKITLIDIEDSKERDFGFRDSGAGYSNLDKARDFLTANGVKKGDLTLVNPQRDPVPKGDDFDLVVSFLSCGFHYPLSTYETLFVDCTTAGGTVVVDVRERTLEAQSDMAKRIGDTLTSHQPLDGATRLFLAKGQG